ncbi:uncharacterized protein LOC132995937 isoform X2 [Limanda limanda]|uniref:uncharacterized protein LOC132995937 isoform X2 n=1 Tax=Limanda limanda TaxID=27771 RepID=UPI0029C79B2E|nr:uncharacterized protein LOC132995937 isoform X2 [Limanda limanda]
MGDVNQFPVFFEVPGPLLRDQRRALEKHFSLRRLSGGAACGPPTRVRDEVFSVAFTSQTDQQRVLQRSEHVVEFADGTRWVLVVRGSLESSSAPPVAACSPSPGSTSPVQKSLQSIPASIPPPSGEECELRPDTYLLRYLKECPQAWKELETELASMDCSAQLCPEEGRLTVRRSAQPGAGAESRSLKAEVDKLLQGYSCHFEFDLLKVKALLRSRQAADDVREYPESGMVVVVGKHSQVNARLMDIEELMFQRRSGEKQTSIRRMGEAKLRLLWREIEEGLGKRFPGVQVTRRDAGQVALEGSLKDVVEAGEWISGRENLVLERRVSNMSPHLLAFLRKAYGGPGALQDFLGVGDEVEIELRDIELCFFSLSPDKLDDPANKMQEKFKELKIDLPNSSAVPSELREKLTSKTSEMNQGQLRAQAVFYADSTVCLLGHTKEVEELNETVIQYILDQSSSQPREVRIQTDTAGGDMTRGATAGAPGDNVHVEAVQGTIETQQVDALVSPMVGPDPLSTLIGDILSNLVGSQSDLIPRFKNEGGEESMPGDAVLVEGVTGLPSKAIFFLNLVPWDDDEDGTAVQVLRLGINNILASCETRGFGSVALPVLGAGSALRFPHSVIARALLEEVHGFKQNRASRTPLLVRITIHPSDTEAPEVFKEFIEDTHQPDQATGPMRIVLLGKTGSGKSALANNLLGTEELFRTSSSSSSGTIQCQAETGAVHGRSMTLIDTPGLFDTDRSEEDLRSEITRCMVELAPGPHAFLIVLKVERFTEQEQATIIKILQYFSEDALKYAVIVFTHGKQLEEGQSIQEFVSQNRTLSNLVEMCGGRCHVFDNKAWNNNQKKDYRSNQFQAEELLDTIEKMVKGNKGGYYTNNALQGKK